MVHSVHIKQGYSKRNDRVSSRKHSSTDRRIEGHLLRSIRRLLGWKRHEESRINKRGLCSRARIPEGWKSFRKHTRYEEVRCTRRAFRHDRCVSNSIEVPNGLHQVHRNVGRATWMSISNGVFRSQFYLMPKK